MEVNSRKLLYAGLLAAHVGLVWALSWFPTQDGPAHIYNLVILHDLLHGGREWGNFFTYKLSAVPNLGFNLLSYPLLNFFPPLVVERIFVSLYILLMGMSVPVLLKTFERPVFPMSFLVFPVVFNFTLLMGFYSYAVAVPLFVLAFSMAWHIRRKSAVCRFVCFNLAGIILFYLHLIPFMFFLISLYAIVVAESEGIRTKLTSLIQLSLTTLPCILQFFLYVLQGKGGGIADLSYLVSRERNTELIRDLMYFSTVNYSPLQVIPAYILLFAFLFFLLLFVYGKAHDKYRAMGTKIPKEEKAIILVLSALTVIYFLAPLHFGGGSFFNQRFPWVIFIVALPLLRVPQTPLLHYLSIVAVTGAVGVNFAVNAFLMQQQSDKVGKYVAGLGAGLPKGAFVMNYKTKDEWSRIDELMHAASYYGIFAGCVDIGNYATRFDYFPVHFRHTLPAFPPPSQIDYEPDSINWAEYPSIQYLIGWEVDEMEKQALGESYRLIWQDEPLSIWQRAKIAQETGGAHSGNHGKILQGL